MKFQRTKPQTLLQLLSLVALVVIGRTSAFAPLLLPTRNTGHCAAPLSSATLQAEAGSQQPLYGKELGMPDTYVRCGRCQTIYALTEEDLGEKGKG